MEICCVWWTTKEEALADAAPYTVGPCWCPPLPWRTRGGTAWWAAQCHPTSNVSTYHEKKEGPNTVKFLFFVRVFRECGPSSMLGRTCVTLTGCLCSCKKKKENRQPKGGMGGRHASLFVPVRARQSKKNENSLSGALHAVVWRH